MPQCSNASFALPAASFDGRSACVVRRKRRRPFTANAAIERHGRTFNALRKRSNFDFRLIADCAAAPRRRARARPISSYMPDFGAAAQLAEFLHGRCAEQH
jgi:hypothetical protein